MGSMAHYRHRVLGGHNAHSDVEQVFIFGLLFILFLCMVLFIKVIIDLLWLLLWN